MDFILIFCLVIGFTLIGISWLQSELRCPPPKIIYRFVPKHTLDTQFSLENRPSMIYKDMFEKASVFLHSRGIGDGKSIIENKFN
jgi:hypothetical protein